MDEIRDRVRAIRSLAEFDRPDWWLTFYLSASQARLERIVPQLRSLGAVNLDGEEIGFLYPKLRVQSEPDAVATLVSQVRALAEADEVQVLSVDVDTTPEVGRSEFSELLRF